MLFVHSAYKNYLPLVLLSFIIVYCGSRLLSKYLLHVQDGESFFWIFCIVILIFDVIQVISGFCLPWIVIAEMLQSCVQSMWRFQLQHFWCLIHYLCNSYFSSNCGWSVSVFIRRKIKWVLFVDTVSSKADTKCLLSFWFNCDMHNVGLILVWHVSESCNFFVACKIWSFII